MLSFIDRVKKSKCEDGKCELLGDLWKSYPATEEFQVLGFYGEADRWGELNNSRMHAGFVFELPAICRRDWAPATIEGVTFAEKPIMLCKALIMDDMESFQRILLAGAPVECKELGK